MNQISKFTIMLLTLLLVISTAIGQTTYETISSGSYIIDMGVTPQTTGNALKPYGLVYDLTTNQKVPIKWVIDPNKASSNSADFTHNGIQYKNGPFVIPAEFRNSAVDAVVASWTAQGVVVRTSVSDITVPVSTTIKYFMGWTLDDDNGAIAEEYLQLAGFPSSSYNWLRPDQLTSCNDVFVMPHADPEWSTHSNLLQWNNSIANGGSEGTIWAACHAVSALEGLYNPSNRSEQMNFLSEKRRNANGSDGTYADNALILWGDHDDGTPPNTYTYHTDPVMQFVGDMDDAIDNGSEQIYIPYKKWRNSTKIAGYDPNHPEASGSSVAAVLAYGSAFGEDDRGMVMYQAGHDHAKDTDADNIAAIRAFLNFSFWASAKKSTRLEANISTDSIIAEYEPASVTASATGGSGTYSYAWSSSCGGTFSDPTASSTQFTSTTTGTCILTVTATDACGRVTFGTITKDIQANPCSITENKNIVRGSVFEDKNGNGEYDANEYAIDNIDIDLYEDVNQNGILDISEQASLLSSTITANDGTYEFEIDPVFGASQTISKRVNNDDDDGLEDDDEEVDLENSKIEMKDDKPYNAIRFRNVNIPQGAIIENAYIEFRAEKSESKSVDLEISIEASSNAAVLDDDDRNLSDRYNNNNTVDWGNVESWSKNSTYNTPNISALIQSVTGDQAWSNNNSLVLIVKWISGDERKAYSHDGWSSRAPRLVVTYRTSEYPIQYITAIDESTLPAGAIVSTANVQFANFALPSQSHCYKDFGLNINRTLAVNDVNVTFANMTVGGSVIRNDIDKEQDEVNFGAYIHQLNGTNLSTGATLSGYNKNNEYVANAGTLSFDADGEYNFVPANDFSGRVQLNYNICDDGAESACDEGILTLIVNDFPNPNIPENNSVIPVNDFDVAYGTNLSGNVLHNDNDPEQDGYALAGFKYTNEAGLSSLVTAYNQSITVTGTNVFGNVQDNAGTFSISSSGAYTFIPADNFAGTVELSYKLCDDFTEQYKSCKEATLILEVESALQENDAPYAGDDFTLTFANRPVIGSWLSNDGDANGDDLKLNGTTVSNDPIENIEIGTYATVEEGSVTFYSNGSFEYTPKQHYYGPDQLAYNLCDNAASSKCDSATIYFIVAPLYYDYGDLPGMYPSAGHMIPIDFDDDVRPDMPLSIWFGETVDHEFAMQNNTDAQGDNQDGTNDEDGLVFPQEARLGETVDFQVKVNSSEELTTVYFGLWFDWDFDGTFDDFYQGSGVTPGNEQRATSSITVSVDLPSPATMTDGKVGVRLRAFQTMPNSTQFSGNTRSGEVEDYIMYTYMNGTALPVELAYFEVETIGNDAQLSWKTETEINNDYFAVQKSTDAMNWEEIGIVEGNGTTTVAQDYDFVDADLSAGTYFYRLQQFDFDGTNEFSAIKSVVVNAEEAVANREIAVYPNPVHINGEVTVSGVENDVAEVVVYDLNGTAVAATTFMANTRINVADLGLNAGIYIFNIVDGSYMQNEKIIVFK